MKRWINVRSIDILQRKERNENDGLRTKGMLGNGKRFGVLLHYKQLEHIRNVCSQTVEPSSYNGEAAFYDSVGAAVVVVFRNDWRREVEREL